MATNLRLRDVRTGCSGDRRHLPVGQCFVGALLGLLYNKPTLHPIPQGVTQASHQCIRACAHGALVRRARFPHQKLALIWCPPLPRISLPSECGKAPTDASDARTSLAAGYVRYCDSDSTRCDRREGTRRCIYCDGTDKSAVQHNGRQSLCRFQSPSSAAKNDGRI